MNYHYRLNQPFIDSSQILEEYLVERDDAKSPLILKPSFSHPAQNERHSKRQYDCDCDKF